jgi:hypothetical protein
MGRGINSGKAWSSADYEELRHAISVGLPLADIADFLLRDEDEVRAKLQELAPLREPGTSSHDGS